MGKRSITATGELGLEQSTPVFFVKPPSRPMPDLFGFANDRPREFPIPEG